MSSSSKYAALPYIAAGEQDIFETEDLPESEQSTVGHSVGDASVEIIPSGTVEAFQKFAVEDAKSIKNDVCSSEESFEDKLQRLKLEVEEIRNCAKAQSDSKLNLDEVSELVNRLANLRDHLSNSYEPVKIPENLKINDQTVDGKDLPLLKYELFSKPSNEEVKLMSKLNSIDQRINKVENLIGTAQNPSALREESIMAAVLNLRNKVLQLDHSSLDKLDAKLSVILDKVKRISENKSCLEEIEKENKLNELYECYVRTNENKDVLMNTFERLQVLNNLQEQASYFSSTLGGLNTAHDEIQLSMDKNSKTLKAIQDNFTTKTQEIKSVLDDFNKRLDKLKN